jgi:hypothetical protein
MLAQAKHIGLEKHLLIEMLNQMRNTLKAVALVPRLYMLNSIKIETKAVFLFLILLPRNRSYSRRLRLARAPALLLQPGAGRLPAMTTHS